MNRACQTLIADEVRALPVRVTEVYASVQGESSHAGKPCTFVRLAGCPLRCRWCDSTYTFTGGDKQTVGDVLDEVVALGPRTVELTGGEPLVQASAVPLLQAFVDLGFEVLLETSGAVSIADVPAEVHVILDLKAPGSGEVARNDWSNLQHLRPHHEVKLVLADRDDYLWARDVIREHDLAARCTVLLSPVWGELDPQTLVGWMLEDRLPARLNLQIHKVVWDADTAGV